MAQIAYILLCHKDPAGVIRQARRLVAGGDKVSIHYDARAPREEFDRMKSALDGADGIVLVTRRERCGWGEWSLVAATLSALRAAVSSFPDATHFYMLSGDCMPIKPAAHVHVYLDREDVDYIETNDFFESDWIRTGPKEERLIYRHYVNERGQKRLFYAAMEFQKRLGLSRRVPADLRIMIGSQWWCLRRETVKAVLEFIQHRPDVVRFFKTTWIPDETFFQTLVPHLVPSVQLRSRTLTFLMFSDYGMPVTFYNDQYDLLVGQDYLFARKISPEAQDLRDRLGRLYQSDAVDLPVTSDGVKTFRFVTERGRTGCRFAPRFWEVEASLGRERELMIVTCKKWHVAKRLLDALARHSNIPAVGYLFDEADTPLPEMGGAERTLAKRARHRRALMRMLYDHFESDRMVICVDPGNIEILQDFHADRSETKLLEVECSFSNEYLVGHAVRVGLLAQDAAPGTIARILPTIRNDVLTETDRLRDARFPEYSRISEVAAPSDNAQALESFFSIAFEAATDIAETTSIYED